MTSEATAAQVPGYKPLTEAECQAMAKNFRQLLIDADEIYGVEADLDETELDGPTAGPSSLAT